MECGRCGVSFRYKSHLERHLRKEMPCPPTKSLMGQKILLEKLEKATRKPFACSRCKASYSHQKSLNRHMKECTKEALLAKILESNQELHERLDRLQQQLVAAPAQGSVPSATINSQNIVGGVNNTMNNTTVNAPTYNIRAWDPNNIDVEALDAVHKETQNNPINHAFLYKYQAEALMAKYMELDPPGNYFFYAPTKSIEDIRVFDGTAFRKPEDPREALDAGRRAFHEVIMFRARTNEDALRYTCDYYEKDFDTQKAYLEQAAMAPLVGSHENIIDKLHQASPQIKQAIEAEHIQVE